jgi:hypothetical protein
MKFDSGK